MKRTILIAGILMMLVCPVFAGAELIDRIVAKVNNDVILLSEFDEAYQPLAEELQQRTPSDQQPEQLKRLRNQVLDNLIDEKLLVQRGKESGIDVDDAEVNEAINNLRKNNNLQDDQAFAKALAMEGLDLQALRTRLRSQMIASRVQMREVRSKAEVTEGDIAAYYEQHAAEFSQPEKLRLQVLFLPFPQEAGQLRRAQVYSKRDEIAAALKSGADFNELVKKYSEGPAADSGGDIGWVAKADLAADFAKIAFSLEPGQVSAPVENELGINFFKVAERQTAGKTPLKDVNEEIRRKVLEERLRTAALRFADELREKAYIEKMLP